MREICREAQCCRVHLALVECNHFIKIPGLKNICNLTIAKSKFAISSQTRASYLNNAPVCIGCVLNRAIKN